MPVYNRFYRGEWITWVSGGEGALDTPGPKFLSYWIRRSLMQNYGIWIRLRIQEASYIDTNPPDPDLEHWTWKRFINCRIWLQNWLISIYSLFNRRQPTCKSSLCWSCWCWGDTWGQWCRLCREYCCTLYRTHCHPCTWAQIFKLLRSPGIDSKKSLPPA